jgi:adenylate cyclase
MGARAEPRIPCRRARTTEAGILTRIRATLTDPIAGQVLAVFGGANVVGAVVVFFYANLASSDSGATALSNMTWGPSVLIAYLTFSGVVGLLAGVRVLGTLEWTRANRRPADDERANTLLVPWRFVVLSALLWVGGNVVFTVGNVLSDNPGSQVVSASVGTAMGGATTSLACYLLVERVLRPVFAKALRDGPLPTTTFGVRQRIVLAWALGSGIPLLGIATSPFGPERPSLAVVATLGLIGLVFGSVLVGVATRSVSDRLTEVRHALARVQRGDLNAEVPVDEAGEIGQLQAGVNAMVHGLRERSVIADLFGRHVGPEVARQALHEGVHLGGEQRDVSALFLDVTGSTTLAATRAPTDVLAMLNELFGTVVRVVEEEGGWVDKFEGDAVLCVFGAPVPLADHPTRALATARRLAGLVGALDFGIGVSSGLVVAGNIGSETRFEYTVIGDPVNEASRLTEAAKLRPTRVLAACRTLERASAAEAACWQRAETLQLRGRPEPTETCEPIRVPTVPPTLARPKGA